jgi:hypothetical protein
MNNHAELILSLQTEINNLKKRVEQLENRKPEQVVEQKATKKTKSKSIPKPEGMPTQARPTHVVFKKLFAEDKNAMAKIINEVNNKNFTDEKTKKAEVSKLIMHQWYLEKGHKEFDEKGKPKDKADPSKFSERVKQTLSINEQEKKKYEEAYKIFRETDKGKKYEEEKSKEDGKKKESAPEKKEVQSNQVSEEFTNLLSF